MPRRCGDRSRQFSRPGLASGASAILKSSAPSALVRTSRTSSPRPCRMMLDIVLHRFRAAATSTGCASGTRQIEQPRFRSLVIVHRDVGEAAGLQPPERHEEAAVGLLVDEHVVSRRRCRADADRRATGGDWRRAAHSRRRMNPRVHTGEPPTSGITSDRSLPVARSRMRSVSYSDPFSSADHASSL